MATHSSILAWKIPWTEEPGRLYSPWGHKELDTTKQLTHTANTTFVVVSYDISRKLIHSLFLESSYRMSQI